MDRVNEIGLVVGIKCTHRVYFRGLALEIKKKKSISFLFGKREIGGVQSDVRDFGEESYSG